MNKQQPIKRRSLNIPLANPGYSNGTKKLKNDNKLLLDHLKRLETGPFGIKRFFKKPADQKK